MCLVKDGIKYLNPSSDLFLYSHCINNCSSIIKFIQWNIYYRLTNNIEWKKFNSSENNYLIGKYFKLI